MENLAAKFPLIVMALVLLLLGFLSIYPPTVKKLIKLRNDMNGTKTNITRTTIVYSQVGGIVIVVIAILILTGVLFPS